jgi:hypothetical protein
VSSPDFHGTVQLGDRGDGTPASRAAAKLRYAHINRSHIPDIIRHSTKPHCYEIKVITPFHTSPNLGTGAGASTAEGGTHAMGNTEEKQLALNTGVPACGDAATDGPFNRRSGAGHRAATSTHDYADALSRGNGVSVFVMETTGAFNSQLERALRYLAALSRTPLAHDHTQYGTLRHSVRAFYSYHAAAVSAAIAAAESQVIIDQAIHLSHALALGFTA